MSTAIMSDDEKDDRPQTVTLQLAQVGDRELWVLNDPDGLWSLPMFLEWRTSTEDSSDEFAAVWPAVSPYPLQLLSIRGMLEAHSITDSHERWILRKSVAIRILKKAQGITPKFYYRWPDRHFYPIPATTPGRLEVDVATKIGHYDWESFLKRVSERYGLPVTMLRIFWRAVTSEAPEWMLENRQALDMGFCKLVALPYRPNWKEIVSLKLKHFSLLTLFKLPQEQRRPALEAAGLPQALCSPENISAPQGKLGSAFPRLTYCLEAIPMKRFEKAVNVVEGKRLAAGQGAYVASYEATVEKHYEHILAALEAYLHKVFLPFARLLEGGYAGLPRFVSTRGGKAAAVNPNRPPAFILPPGKAFSAFGTKGVRPAVRKKTATLPPVPIVPHGTSDVRESAGGGSSGVPLLHAGEGGPAAIQVLSVGAPSDGGAPRVAGESES